MNVGRVVFEPMNDNLILVLLDGGPCAVLFLRRGAWVVDLDNDNTIADIATLEEAKATATRALLEEGE